MSSILIVLHRWRKIIPQREQTPKTNKKRLHQNVYKQNYIKQTKRPNFLVNRHHANDRINYRPKAVPGKRSYKDVVSFGKKTLILGTGSIQGIRLKEFNQLLKNQFTKIRSFSGVSTNNSLIMQCRLLWMKPQVVLSSMEVAMTGKKATTEESIARSGMDLANMCRDYGVNKR